MDLYRRHLRNISSVLGILSVLIILPGIPLMRLFPELTAGIRASYVLCRCLVGLACAAVAWTAARKNAFYRLAFLCDLLLLAAAVTLTILFGGNKLDDLTDIMTLMIVVVVYTLFSINRFESRWQLIMRRRPDVLDLRVQGAEGLFNPIVLGPHLELDQGLVDAVDRYLATAGTPAPLSITIHCAEKVSLPLQGTMREIFRSHYEDEERRVKRYLSGRYSRGIFLLLISIGSLTVWERFMRQYSSSTLWQVLGNFAAFSLWQIGNTYFERSEAIRELTQILIAKNAEIQFL